MTVIAVDCDEVLCQTLDAVLAFHNFDYYGKPLTKEVMTDYYLYKIPQYNTTTPQEMLNYFAPVLEWEQHKTIKQVPGAKQKLTQRKKDGHTLKVVTWRPSKWRHSTQQRVHDNFPGLFDDVIFAEHLTHQAVPKSQLCKQIGATIMIEDNLDYCIDTAWAWITSFLLDYPWNRHYDPTIHTGISKVQRRDEISL